MLLLAMLACTKTDNTEGKAVVGIETDGSQIADIIRNPVSAQSAEVDTTQLARFQFSEERFNFGEVDEGAVIEHEFRFTNAGQVPLVISDVRTTCGCTVADYPRDPILPGAGGAIRASFDTKNKPGRQSKPITITANTYPAKMQLHLDGFVYGAEE